MSIVKSVICGISYAKTFFIHQKITHYQSFLTVRLDMKSSPLLLNSKGIICKIVTQIIKNGI